MSRPRLPQALGIGILFGVVEATTPLLGWLLGSAASRFVASIDHWVAFVLLAGLGIHMVWKSFQPLEPDCDDQTDAPYDTGVQLGADGSALRAGRLLPAGLLSMLLTSVATSIDAMAVGVTLAFVDVPIGQVALVIGLCTTMMVTLGVMLGRRAGHAGGPARRDAGRHRADRDRDGDPVRAPGRRARAGLAAQRGSGLTPRDAGACRVRWRA